MKITKCATLEVIEAISVEVETTFTRGLPAFSIVGLASSAIQESKDRIKSALITNEFKFPPLKITVNLSPSEVVKNGTQFDLPIALLIVLYNNKTVQFNDFYIFGELGLDGKLKDTNFIFVLILSLINKKNIKNVLVPKDSLEKISKIPNINIYAVDTLNEAIEFFTCEDKERYRYTNKEFDYKFININNRNYFYDTNYKDDFIDVKGQKIAKKAALLSATGNHNILFIGSAGCGKSMISKRIRYIMPPMSLEEILIKAKLDSFELLDVEFSPIRVFRSPHHTSTKASIFGGGSVNAKIGEVALANDGILFFDELPHFGRNILEALREPLEDNKLLISRVNNKIKYDTKITFISTMNPCPCGNLLSTTKECRCNDMEINRYKNKLSEPFLDRIDLYITMNEVNFKDVGDVSSEELHSKVINAFILQKERGQTELNGKLSDKEIEKFCILDDSSKDILYTAIDRFSLSFRSINKILKVSRTIADLEGQKNISKSHLLESLSYRRR